MMAVVPGRSFIMSEQDQNLLLLENELKTINRTRRGRRAFLQAFPLLLAGCATSPKYADRSREGDNTGQEIDLTPADERKMSEEYLPQMKKEYPAHPDRELQAYIDRLGQGIVQKNQLGGNPYNYTFTVCESKNVNAFALPAGPVFVTAPLIQMAETEAELAGVVGHEIGHIQARHTAERIAMQKKEQNRGILLGIGGALLGGAAGFGLAKLICSENDKECMRRISMYGAAAGVGGGLLIQKFAFMAHSREDEMEADRISFRTAAQAGYDKAHVGTFYTKLLEMEKQYQKDQNSILAPFADAMSTHPPGKERVVQMQQMVRNSKLGSGKVSSTEFERMKKRI